VYPAGPEPMMITLCTSDMVLSILSLAQGGV
jgi:hypothetical protein